MSKFVNYNKRDITLPQGKKNLIELLQPECAPNPVGSPHAGAVSSEQPPIVLRDESCSAKIQDLEKHFTTVFESREVTSMLVVTTPADEEFEISIVRTGEGILMAHFGVSGGTDREKAVRSFLVHRGFNIPEDCEMPSEFQRGLGWQAIFDVLPPPPEPANLSILAEDLLLEVFGLSGDSLLTFKFLEIKYTK